MMSCSNTTTDKANFNLLWLNHSYKSWEEARHVFAEKLGISSILNSPRNLIHSHDTFAVHLLDVHRLNCSKCDAGVLPQSLPDKKALLCADTGTQTEPELQHIVPGPVLKLIKTNPNLAQDEPKANVNDATNLASCLPCVSTTCNGKYTWTKNSSGTPVLRGPKGHFVRATGGRKTKKRREYERKSRPVKDEQDNLNAAPSPKRIKTSEPKENPPTLEPRKSLRIKGRIQSIKEHIQSQAEPLQDSSFTLPTTTASDDEDDGWIEDSSNSEILKEVKQEFCMPSMTTSNLGPNNRDDSDSEPATKYKTTIKLRLDKSKDAVGQPVTKNKTTGKLGPNTSNDSDSQPATKYKTTPNLGSNSSKHVDSLTATNFKSTSSIGPNSSIHVVANSQPVTKCNITSNMGPNSRIAADTKCKTTSNLGPDNSMDRDSPATNPKASPWKTKLRHVTIPEFSGPSPGPTVKLPTHNQEIDFFRLLFPADLIGHLVVETNDYAEQCLAAHGNLAQWPPTTLNEMVAFLGLQVLMSVWVLPDLSMYWSKDRSHEGIKVSEVMSKHRFQALLQYFHCGSLIPEKSRARHAVFDKACTVLDIINECCRLRYSPHRECSVNEVKMKLANEQQVDICLLVDCESGYCSEFQVCPAEIGPGEKQGVRDRLVLDVTHRLKKKHYIVNMSESFTNLELLETLVAKGILGRGAVNDSQKNLPDLLFNKSICRNMVFQHGNITACSWYNAASKRHVISSADDPKVVYSVQQKYKGVSLNTQCPRAVVHYMKCMYSNPFRNPYPTQWGSGRKETCIFWIAFDIALSNAFILKHGSGCTQSTIGPFRRALSQQLIQCFMHEAAIYPRQLRTRCIIDRIRFSKVTGGLGMQSHPLHSEGTDDNIQISKVTGGLSMQSDSLHSEGTDDSIRISKIAGGLGMQSHPLHSDGSDDSIQISKIIGGLGMQSDPLHSEGTDDSIRISKVTGGLGMQSDPMHSDGSDDSIQISKLTGGLGMQSDPLHSEGTNDSIRISKVTGGLGIQSDPMHSDGSDDSIQISNLTGGLGMQSDPLHSEGTDDSIRISKMAGGLGMQSHPLHSDGSDDSIQISRIIGGLGMQSDPLHSDCTDDSIQISKVTGGLGMQSHPLDSDCIDDIILSKVTDSLGMQSCPPHSDGTNDSIQISRGADGLGMQLLPLHSAGTYNNAHSARLKDDFGVQSYPLHSDKTDDNIRISKVTAHFGMRSRPLHSNDKSVNIRISRATDCVGMQSHPLDNTDVNIQISRVTGDLDKQPLPLHSECKNITLHPARSNDGIGMQSISLQSAKGSQLQSAKPVSLQIAQRIKVEPDD